MAYGIDIWDESGRAIEPGYVSGTQYRSSQPLPIPLVGDYLHQIGEDKWKVVTRTFTYTPSNDKADETDVLVTLTVKKA
jgi:hypothetical protein